MSENENTSKKKSKKNDEALEVTNEEVLQPAPEDFEPKLVPSKTTETNFTKKATISEKEHFEKIIKEQGQVIFTLRDKYFELKKKYDEIVNSQNG